MGKLYMYMYVYIIVANVCDIFSVACLKLSLTPSIVTINLHMVVETLLFHSSIPSHLGNLYMYGNSFKCETQG